MKLRIDPRQHIQLPFVQAHLKFFNLFFKSFEFFGLMFYGGQSGRIAFQHTSNTKGLFDVISTQAQDGKSAPRLPLNEPLAFQLVDCLPDRRTTDSQHLRNMTFNKPFSRRNVAPNDGLLQVIENMLSQGFSFLQYLLRPGIKTF